MKPGVADEPGALVFPGVKGGPLQRGNFNRMSGWPQAVKSIDAEGLHFHDLRRPGNTFAETGTKLRDLMSRMGHDGERAAMIYQHESRGADQAITNAIDRPVQTEHRGAWEAVRFRPLGALTCQLRQPGVPAAGP
jgi:integrase